MICHSSNLNTQDFGGITNVGIAQGNFTGSLITLIILACFGPALYGEGKYGQLDAIWRLQIGLALIPALATLYPRLTMPEGRKFLESRELNRPQRPESVSSHLSRRNRKSRGECVELVTSDGTGLQEEIDAARAEVEEQGRRPRLDVFFVYFSEWRHLKVLLGTAMTWFFMDVAFYGTNLNQSVILQEIGFSKGSNEYDVLKRNTIGNLIIAVAGYVPGYFVTILFIEKLGRRWIQIQGFLIAGLMFGIIAGGYNHIGTGGKFVCLAFAQVRQEIPSAAPYVLRLTNMAVFLQLRAQRHHLHCSSRSVPLAGPRVRPWRQRRNRQARRNSLRSAFQLPEWAHHSRPS